MPQISLYVSQDNLQKIRDASQASNLSISQWVSSKILSNLEPSFPKDYALLCGSISDVTFKRPKQIDFKVDSKRESL